MNTYCDSHISSLESNSNPRQATKLQKPKLSSIPQVCCVSKVCRYGARPAYCWWTDMKMRPNAPFSNRTRSHSQWSAQFGAFCSKRATSTCARAMQSFPKGSSATFQSSEMGRFTKWHKPQWKWSLKAVKYDQIIKPELPESCCLNHCCSCRP